MNAGMELVRSYLKANGYLLVGEMPVIQREAEGQFRAVTDVDILAVRFPWARLIVQDPQGRRQDLTGQIDPILEVPAESIDVIIAEVKEGRAHLNPALRSGEVLEVALARVGICPRKKLGKAVDALRTRGIVTLGGSCGPFRVRLVAFGSGASRRAAGYSIISLQNAAAYLRTITRDYHEILQPAQIEDPFIGFLHLLNKLDE